jgi:hypothetical protein
MNSIIDKLCLKRLCLPSNTDITLVHNGTIKSHTCICDTSKHIAVCFKERQYLKCAKLWDQHV